VAVVDQIVAAAQSQGVDPSLAIEVARAESGLNPNTPDSSAGAIGLFQIEPATAAQLGINPRDPAQNIQGGIAYLRMMLSQFGDVATALAAYDWGPGHVSTALAQYGANFLAHAPAETQKYVSKILGGLKNYSAVLTPQSVANGVSDMVASAADAIFPASSDGSGGSAAPAAIFPDLSGLLILGGIAFVVYLATSD